MRSSVVEYIVFVVPTQIQIDLYEAIISGGAIANLLDDDPRQPGGTSPLVLMDGLRKLCNSAGLLKRQSDTVRDFLRPFESLTDAVV